MTAKVGAGLWFGRAAAGEAMSALTDMARFDIAAPERAFRAGGRPRQQGEKAMYIDGFVCAVPTANREAYRAHAEAAADVFKECGATSVVECWGDDVPDGKLTSFPLAVQRKDDETVVFSWIAWPSREMRDAGMKRAMNDPRLSPDANPMPFDGKRLIYGGFEAIVTR